ncbi:MAG: indolepyruvate oxidoreductase subunit beta [Duncaniella sp.]|nr:indolepyruvate oxidoreductase subunit beta [Duncaniella sp.]MDE6496172.1 indolepyruvate oxidoreductase subunit beta [Duncaniella sp.]HBI58205.1 indolepyruvate oxidoreductase subunit beta [Porphyromonadaceae bacterium]
MKTDIILAGVGGQGILSIASILGVAALEQNLYLKQAEVHGMSQRGGDVQSNLRLSSSPVHSDLIPLGKADMVVSLEPMEALRYVEYLNPQSGWIVTSTAPFVNIPNYPEQAAIDAALASRERVVAFDMEAAAREIASPRSSNMVLLGACSPLLDIDPSKLEDGIRAIFARKGEKIVEANIAAFRLGREKAIEMRSGK